MNADLGANLSLALAAEVDAPGRGVAKVEFFDGDRLVGTATQAPFRATYQPDKPQLNFCLTAKVTDDAGRSAVSPPVTCVATSKVQRQFKSYDFEETAEQMLKQVRLWIPDELATVRGILIVSNSAGGDTRDSIRENWFREFLYLHDFAFLGTKGFSSHIESLQVMQHAPQDIAPRANHPELINVPYVTTGFSAGGGYASRLLVDPDNGWVADNTTWKSGLTSIAPAKQFTGAVEKSS